MKILLLFGALLAAPTFAGAALGLTASEQPPTASKVAVFFNRATTFTQLVTIKQEVLKDGLVLEYDRLEFDNAGHLFKISYHVDSDGATLGRASTDKLPTDYSFGFVRDFTPGAKTPFHISQGQ